MAIVACVLVENSVLAQTEKTLLKLQAADNAVGQAFSSVLDAEKAGGNVTRLLVKLNAAEALLAEAQNAYNSGNPTNVLSVAENVQQIADQVNLEAKNLRNVSLVESQNVFLLTLGFSVVGAVVFGLLLLFIWRRFKRAFIKKLFNAKPVVVKIAGAQFFSMTGFF